MHVVLFIVRQSTQTFFTIEHPSSLEQMSSTPAPTFLTTRKNSVITLVDVNRTQFLLLA